MPELQQASPFDQYARGIRRVLECAASPADHYRLIRKWYHRDGGRALFLQAFKHETGLKVNPGSDIHSRIGSAIPRGVSDYDKKLGTYSYYRAHAEMFILEMDSITSRVPDGCEEPGAPLAYGNVLRFTHKVLRDSIVLFEDWGRHYAGVPEVFGGWLTSSIHPADVFKATEQAIYGHGSFGLAAADNFSDVAFATIRQGVELRLRSGFGVIGKEVRGTLHPVPLSKLLEVLHDHRGLIKTPVHLEHLRRILDWANLFLHAGIRRYAWMPPRVLEYLRPLLLGGEHAGGEFTAHSGIRLTASSLRTIRQALKARIEASAQAEDSQHVRAVLLAESSCAVAVLESIETCS